MKVEELNLYYKLDEKIYERANMICDKLDLLYECSVEPSVNESTIRMSIIDYEDDEVDSLTMSFEDFCADDYIERAIKQRERDKEEQRLSKLKAEKRKEELARQERKALYKKLKREFEE